MAVGVAVGLAVGAPVGVPVGASVGVGVGAAVGSVGFGGGDADINQSGNAETRYQAVESTSLVRNRRAVQERITFYSIKLLAIRALHYTPICNAQPDTPHWQIGRNTCHSPNHTQDRKNAGQGHGVEAPCVETRVCRLLGYPRFCTTP